MSDTVGRPRPIVIAHRGACGYRPEHTLASYQLAIDLGADYLEIDLLLTRDGVLVARHDAELSTSTDVAERPEFAHRRRRGLVDGRELTGWFIDDFSLAELKTLYARERIPELRPANQAYDGRLRVPTFDEIITLAVEGGRRRGRPVGLYPELKHPTYFAERGLSSEDALMEVLRGFRLERAGIPVFVQSYEPAVLRRLAARTSVPLVQLVDITGRPYDWERAEDGRRFVDMLTPTGLREVSAYAAVLGAHKSLVVPRDPEGRLGHPGRLVSDAHDLGMAVHTWTFRNENSFLPADRRRGWEAAGHGDALGEFAVYYGAGVDGVFTDHPDTAVAARDQAFGSRSRRSLLSDAMSPASPIETSSTGMATSRPDKPSTS
ncbi:glycerophosphodiester phosphodiesterase [Jiangella ureilytica]|uniref:glycerophosphodiester phosphodiesterase n=1 Tax=Jiangella ureilytica TaxID=2530374 RepID=A0A4R4RL08_9ACTN|nr:glycerophosphodiester phosphodiesterase family protein [Jiangella ureilytica]TDC49193.1 glycerophosphodiester phosphodiesterase [Jiangella ureilytica]